MTQLHEAIAAYLGASVSGLSYSTTADTGNVYLDHTPQEPDRVVGVFPSAGPEADSKLPYDPVEFQIIVRGDIGGVWALDTWAAVYSALHGLRAVTMSGVYVVFILATQASPFLLDDDENGRPQYSCNFRGEVLNVTAHRP